MRLIIIDLSGARRLGNPEWRCLQADTWAVRMELCGAPQGSVSSVADRLATRGRSRG